MPLKRKPTFKKGDRGAAVTIHVKNGSGAARFEKILEDGTIVVASSQSNVASSVYQEIISLFAKILKLKAAQIEILAGQNTQDKLIGLVGIDPDRVDELVLKAVGS